jgi:hypothetical protein
MGICDLRRRLFVFSTKEIFRGSAKSIRQGLSVLDSIYRLAAFPASDQIQALDLIPNVFEKEFE